MIHARTPLQDFRSCARTSTLPLLQWRSEWDKADGDGTTIGLVDSGFAVDHPDLIGANIVVRNFVSTPMIASRGLEHGTYDVTTLVGQGVSQILGIAPKAKLLMAIAVGQSNVAQSERVTEALDWLIASNATLIAIPLGDLETYADIAQTLELALQSEIPVFAAAGNSYPCPLLFPACEASTIAVGAVDSAGQLLPFCCRDPQLDIVAPGADIVAPVSAKQVKPCSGSSVACILTAGTALLAMSVHTRLDILGQPNELLKLLIADNWHGLTRRALHKLSLSTCVDHTSKQKSW